MSANDSPVIRIQDVGKCYQIFRRPQDRLLQALFRGRRRYAHDFWALRHVSFEVPRGSAIGVLGRNGAGKSTLLQMIAGTVTPTEGRIEVGGRVSALLELGSGFNPEFSGRENVFLNGAILGLSRAEMQARFDDIAAFAEIGSYIDQPIKTYSSGMFARLAFSVAISVDPDVLIVDEILSVGDMGFQHKCLNRLRQMRERGLTLLYVSHSTDSIKSVCRHGLFLRNGQLVFFGTADEAVDRYLAFIREETNRQALESERGLAAPVPFETQVPHKMRYGTGHVQFAGVEMRNGLGEPCRAFRLGETIHLEATLRAITPVEHLSVSFLVRDPTGVDLMGTTSFDERCELPALAPGQQTTVRFTFANALRPGNFAISLAVNRVTRRDYSDNLLLDQVDGCAAFASMADPQRPVHYKFHQPVEVRVLEGSPAQADPLPR